MCGKKPWNSISSSWLTQGTLETTGLPVSLFTDVLTLGIKHARLCAYEYTWVGAQPCMALSFCPPIGLRVSRKGLRRGRKWSCKCDFFVVGSTTWGTSIIQQMQWLTVSYKLLDLVISVLENIWCLVCGCHAELTNLHWDLAGKAPVQIFLSFIPTQFMWWMLSPPRDVA